MKRRNDFAQITLQSHELSCQDVLIWERYRLKWYGEWLTGTNIFVSMQNRPMETDIYLPHLSNWNIKVDRNLCRTARAEASAESLMLPHCYPDCVCALVAGCYCSIASLWCHCHPAAYDADILNSSCQTAMAAYASSSHASWYRVCPSLGSATLCFSFQSSFTHYYHFPILAFLGYDFHIPFLMLPPDLLLPYLFYSFSPFSHCCYGPACSLVSSIMLLLSLFCGVLCAIYYLLSRTPLFTSFITALF